MNHMHTKKKYGAWKVGRRQHTVSRRKNPPVAGGSPASLSRPELDDFVCMYTCTLL